MDEGSRPRREEFELDGISYLCSTERLYANTGVYLRHRMLRVGTRNVIVSNSGYLFSFKGDDEASRLGEMLWPTDYPEGLEEIRCGAPHP